MRTTFIFLLSWTLSFLGYGQSPNDFGRHHDILPPSPTAAALGSYGEIPVNQSTGTPSIDIPLYQVRGQQLSLGIGLSYSATGVKVDEVPSWVGLKWSLNAGGVITRSARGLPDDHINGWLNTAYDQVDFMTNCNSVFSQACNDFVYDVELGLADPEPDQFFFNFGGSSGQFVFDASGEAHTMPYQNLKISYERGAYPTTNYSPPATAGSVGKGTCILKFVITDVDGTRYEFEKKEVTTNLFDQDPLDNLKAPYVTSWFLSRIISADEQDEILLTYTGDILHMRARNAVSKLLNSTVLVVNGTAGCNPSGFSFSDQRIITETFTWHLASITSALDDVTFATGDRIDLTTPPAGSRLSWLDNSDPMLLETQGKNLASMTISPGGVPTKRFDFTYSSIKHRMYLDKIEEVGLPSNDILPAHLFSYNQRDQLPEPVWTYNRTQDGINNVDMWGYANDASNSGSTGKWLIPSVNVMFGINISAYCYQNLKKFWSADPVICEEADGSTTFKTDFDGADREPDEDAVQYGMMTRIDYPTGGFTEFDFELHEFSKVAGELDETTGIKKNERDYEYYFDNSTSKTAGFWVENNQQPYTESKTFTLGDGDASGTCAIPSNTLSQINFPVEVEITFDKYYPTTPLDDDHFAMVEIYDINDPVNPIETWDAYTLFAPMFSCPPLENISTCGATPCDCATTSCPPQNCFYLNTTKYTSLPAGTYELRVSARTSNTSCNCGTSAPNVLHTVGKVSYPQALGHAKRLGGGLRIKTIHTDDGDPTNNNDVYKNYTYDLENNPCKSSGVLNTFPKFSYSHFEPECIYVMGYSSSQVSLGTTQGSHVSYSYVRETVHGGENGYTEYEFSTAEDYPDLLTCVAQNPVTVVSSVGNEVIIDVNPCGFSFEPPSSRSWQRGDLLSQKVFDANDNIRQQTENIYGFSTDDGDLLSPLNTEIMGLYMHFFPNNPTIPATNVLAVFINYLNQVGLKYLKETTNTTYDDAGNAMVSTTNFYHERPVHGFVTRQRTSNSDGRIIETRYKYLQDYYPALYAAPGPGTNTNVNVHTIAEDEHILLPAIETQVWQGDAEPLDLISSSLTSYYNFGTVGDPVIRPYQNHVLETSSPIPASSYVENVNASGQFESYLPNPSYFSKRGTLDYADNGNLLTAIPLDGAAPKSFIWGHDEALVVAQVSNAAAEDIAYTSFEELQNYEPGGWTLSSSTLPSPINGWGSTYSKTGRRSYDLSPARNMSATVNTAGTYILSYWVKGPNPTTNVSRSLVQSSDPDANGFVYYEYEVDLAAGGTLTLTGTNYGVSLDEVRLYPADARMSTICYDEHLQIHTMTDINNYSTYYQYDDLQRLVSVKDQDGNLLQTQEYHYKQ